MNSDNEHEEYDMEHNPDRWLDHNAEIIGRKIDEFNKLAEERGVTVIVAWRMTKEERDEFLKELEEE